MFQVVDQTGAVHGPVPVDTLRNWASEGRLTPNMTVIDVQTGQQGPAGQLLANTQVFANMPAAAPAPQPQAPMAPQPQAPVQQPMAPQPQPQAYAQPQQGYAQPQQGYAQPQQQQGYAPQGNFAQPAPQFGFQGSTAPGQMPKIGPRMAAGLIDFVIGVGIFGSINSGLDLLLWGYAHAWTFNILYAMPFVIVAYFLFKDVMFPGGQSIGKKIADLKVINAAGLPCTMVQSILRNILIAPLVLIAIPYVGNYVIMPIVSIGILVDLFMVLTTGKRLMDGVAKTMVVNK